MSNSYEKEPKSWPVESEGALAETDFAFQKLREEIASARRVLDRHRDKMSTIGRPPADLNPDVSNDDNDASA